MAYKEIQIGEQKVPMQCKASVNLYYKQIFGEDPIIKQSDGDMTSGEGIIFAQQLAFVMAKAAEANGDRSKMLNLGMDEYIEWLDQFDFMDLQDALKDVMTLYAGGRKSTSQEKTGSAR